VYHRDTALCTIYSTAAAMAAWPRWHDGRAVGPVPTGRPWMLAGDTGDLADLAARDLSASRLAGQSP
jgi:hypothetical protein